MGPLHGAFVAGRGNRRGAETKVARLADFGRLVSAEALRVKSAKAWNSPSTLQEACRRENLKRRNEFLGALGRNPVLGRGTRPRTRP